MPGTSYQCDRQPLCHGWTALSLSVLAAPIQLTGMLVERWLFFAEATHVVTLYYGREQIPVRLT
jgi:DMSO reductase anchor subunit